MDWTAYGLLAAIAAFTLFVWGHSIGYAQGHEDGERFQARQNSYDVAYDAMSEPLDELDEAREKSLQAMLQIAADAWRDERSNGCHDV